MWAALHLLLFVNLVWLSQGQNCGLQRNKFDFKENIESGSLSLYPGYFQLENMQENKRFSDYSTYVNFQVTGTLRVGACTMF